MKSNDVKNIQITSIPGGANYLWDDKGNLEIIQTTQPIVSPDGNAHYVPVWSDEE